VLITVYACMLINTVCNIATKKIIKKVQNKIHAWEQTEKYLRKGVEELTTRFNEKCQLLSKEAIQLDKVLRGEPNLSETQLGKS